MNDTLTIILSNIIMTITLFLWNRQESRQDTRHMEAKLESNRELVRAIHQQHEDFQRQLLDISRRI